MTSPGISSYFVEATNLPTYSVRRGALGKSFVGASPALPTEPARRVDPSILREVLPKSRLNKVHLLFRTLASGCSTVSMENSDHHAGPCRTGSDAILHTVELLASSSSFLSLRRP